MGRGGGMMRPGGGDMMMMNSALQAPAPGRAPNRGHFDDDLNDGPDFGALPSLDDAPKFGARGGSGGGRGHGGGCSNQLHHEYSLRSESQPKLGLGSCRSFV